jgi:hypothetical protein
MGPVRKPKISDFLSPNFIDHSLYIFDFHQTLMVAQHYIMPRKKYYFDFPHFFSPCKINNYFQQGHLECVITLLDNGSDPNAEDFDGRTLTEWREKEAKESEKEKSHTRERSRSNSESKRDGKGKERGFTPLHNAVAYG